jgi:hypothetical protein
MPTETSEVTSADIERRISELGKGEAAPETSAEQPDESEEENDATQIDEDPTIEIDENESAPVSRQEFEELKKNLSKGSESTIRESLLKGLESDPIGTIEAIAARVAELKANEKFAPIAEQQMARDTSEAWKSFSETLSSSGIEIDDALDAAIAKEIKKLPSMSDLAKMDPQMKDPKAVLEYAYWKASKSVKPKVKAQTKEVSNERFKVESSKGAKGQISKVDPNKMPLKDLEKLIGFVEEK